MRYFVGFVFALAMAASPLSVSAQQGEESATTPPALTEPSQETQPTESWLRRMHPAAFDAPTTKPDSGFEIEYASARSQPHTEEGRRRGISKGGKIALGILVPALVVGIAMGAWVGVSVSNTY